MAQGAPADDLGAPADDLGTPADDLGIPMDDLGTPADEGRARPPCDAIVVPWAAPMSRSPIPSRMLRDEADYLRLRGLLADILVRQGPPVDATPSDLDWWHFSWSGEPSDIQTVSLWAGADGSLVGGAWWGLDLVDLFVHPDHRDLQDAMLAWAEGRQTTAWKQGLPTGEGGRPAAGTLTAYAFEKDEARRLVLEQRGYRPTAETAWRFARSLEGDLPRVQLPPGHRVRPLGGDEELEARAAVHRAAFRTSRANAERYRRLQTAPGYRRDHDLVAVGPDDVPVAFTLVWCDVRTGFGLFEPVGCHPDHRRRGLARAVLAEGLRLLAEAGAHTALVGTGTRNEAAVALYESVGFRPLDRLRAWKKSLHP